jgi:hypothetical protein
MHCHIYNTPFATIESAFISSHHMAPSPRPLQGPQALAAFASTASDLVQFDTKARFSNDRGTWVPLKLASGGGVAFKTVRLKVEGLKAYHGVVGRRRATLFVTLAGRAPWPLSNALTRLEEVVRVWVRQRAAKKPGKVPASFTPLIRGYNNNVVAITVAEEVCRISGREGWAGLRKGAIAGCVVTARVFWDRAHNRWSVQLRASELCLA